MCTHGYGYQWPTIAHNPDAFWTLAPINRVVDAVFEQNSHQIQNNFGNDLKLACNLVNAAEKETFAKKYQNIRNFAQI